MSIPYQTKQHVWQDPPENTNELKWAKIGAVIYPTVCLVALGVAHFIFFQPIAIDTTVILLLITSPALGVIFFWAGSFIVLRMK